jgi:peptidoglycan hydrolase-like protein with peptidoglycan-binding domain
MLLVVVVMLAFCVTALVSCKKKDVSPFQSGLPMDNSTITITPAQEGMDVAEPIVIEQGEGKLGVAPTQQPPAVTEPASGAFVAPTPEQIQTALKNAGYYKGDVDGKLGPKSKKAITDFQIDNDLNADGKVGPKTWNKLKVHLEAKKEQ